MLLILVALAVLSHFDASDTELLPSCPLYRYTGLYCPGCGVTRAFIYLANGHPLAALAMNPLLGVAGLILAVYLIFRFAGIRTVKSMDSPVLIWITLAVVFLFTVARNLPWEPFRLLAPGAMLGR